MVKMMVDVGQNGSFRFQGLGGFQGLVEALKPERTRKNVAGFSMKFSKNQQNMLIDPAKNPCEISISTNY